MFTEHKNGYVASLATRALPLKTVSTQEALAVSCAAYRINGSYIKDTRRFSTEENKTQFSNKDLVRFFFEDKTDYLPHDYIPFKLTAEDFEKANELQKWMRRYVMLGLADLDEFKRDMISSAAGEQVPINNLGRIAYLPEFVKRDKHETNLTKEIRVEYRNSIHLGTEKDAVEGVCKILDKRYSSQWETYYYTAVLDGNLISFSNRFEHEVDTMKRIKGKVRNHTVNRLFSANETRLNYVKLYKV